MTFFQELTMLEQPQAGLISRFYRQVENRLKNNSEGEVIIDSAPSINNIKINLQKNIRIYTTMFKTSLSTKSYI